MRPKGSAQELEVRRRLAGRLLLAGKGVREVARLVGASPSSAQRWKEAIDTGGMEALQAKPHPGRPPRLSSRQKNRLVSILRQGPLAAGFPTDLWSCPRVAQVIERTFGVHYHSGHVWYLLRKLGWSAQKPERRARERDEEAIARWHREDWPGIKKSPRRGPEHRFPG
jgi:transposase